MIAYDGDPQDVEPTSADLGGAPCEACGERVCGGGCPATVVEPEGVDVDDEVRDYLIADALWRRGEVTREERAKAADALVKAAVRRSGITVSSADVDEALAAKVEADADEKLREMREHGVRRRGVRV